MTSIESAWAELEDSAIPRFESASMRFALTQGHKGEWETTKRELLDAIRAVVDASIAAAREGEK